MAVELGATYEQVLAEKGTPSGRIEIGAKLVLNYPDAVIRLEKGRVVSIKAPAEIGRQVSQTPGPAVAARPPAVPGGGASTRPLEWLTDYQAAVARAGAQQRRVFLFFTGSDWCVWCRRLDQEVLSRPEFAAYAGQGLVLVKLDFPRGFKLTPEQTRLNQQLAKRYQVKGFPTVVVLDADGRQLGTLGYAEGGVVPFINRVKAL